MKQSCQIQKRLGSLFSAPKPKRQPDSDYVKFRSACKSLGLTYRIAGDDFIELSNGRSFPHYNWGESLDRLTNNSSDQ